MQPRLIRFALACWGLGAALGAGLNAILGALSPEYFRRVMGWDFPGIWSAAVLQGMVEGTVYGLLVALVLGARWLRTKSPLAVLLPPPFGPPSPPSRAASSARASPPSTRPTSPRPSL